MKNIINEKPGKKLTGRLKFTTEFVDSKSIRGKSVLDVGCGYGWFEKFCIESKVKHIYGTEISENDLLTAKENINSKKASFIVAGALKLPFKDNTFDTVVAWEVIEHVPENKENIMFREINRVLKNGGEFYLSTPNDAVLSKYLDPAYYFISHRHYNLSNLINFGLNNGFLLEKTKVVGKFMTSISVLNMYVSKWILRREPILNNYFSKKETQEYKKDGYYNIFVKFRKI
jgi:ubiquinone/menaquinone biosynthesis C-methylase UbiE